MSRSCSKSRHNRRSAVAEKSKPETDIEQVDLPCPLAEDAVTEDAFAELDSLIETMAAAEQAHHSHCSRDYNDFEGATKLNEIDLRSIAHIAQGEIKESQDEINSPEISSAKEASFIELDAADLASDDSDLREIYANELPTSVASFVADLATVPGEDRILLQRIEDRLALFLEEIDQRITSILQIHLSHFIVGKRALAEVETDGLPQKANTSAEFGTNIEKEMAPKSATPQFNWEQQKQQMFAELGLPGDRPMPQVSQGLTCEPNAVEGPPIDKKTSLSDLSSMGNNFDAFRDSVSKLDRIHATGAADARSDELVALKEQLTAQLRDAEIEMSINRAKLSQEWAALEQREAMLAQRESVLKSKYAPEDQEGKSGLLDRFTRHLSRHKLK